MQTKKYLLKIFPILTIIVAAGWLSACVRPVTPGTTPTPQSTNLLDELLTSTPITVATETEAQPSTDAPTATGEAAETSPPEPTNTIEIITPTLSPEPTATGEAAAEETADPTASPAATEGAQPTPDVPQIDPDAEFSGAKRTDTLDQPQMWYDTSGELPDTEYLKLDIVDGSMNVTGKLRLWDTWWISGFSMDNYYIEMEVNSGDCNDDDAYGMIVRASQHGEPSHGYLVGFTCDGKAFAKRLETVDPYTAVAILLPTETNLVNAGKNQTNILGILLDGNTISIYPNRRFFTTLTDDTFSYGRYGVFVQAGDAGNFTYTVTEIRTWGVE